MASDCLWETWSHFSRKDLSTDRFPESRWTSNIRAHMGSTSKTAGLELREMEDVLAEYGELEGGENTFFVGVKLKKKFSKERCQCKLIKYTQL